MAATYYTLTARRGSRTRSLDIPAVPEPRRQDRLRITEEEDLDSDATFAAVARVMELAYSDPLWALGAITLTRPDGTVIHTMEAKES